MAEEFDPTEFAQGLAGDAPSGQQADPADGLAGLLLPTASDEQIQQATAQAGSLRAGAESGELRMEAGVAEECARICDVAVDELNDKVADINWDRRGPMLGDNADGNRASATFAASRQAYIDRVKKATGVFENMAETFRIMGGLVAQTEETNVRGLSGGAE